jgi:hypothetical protein
MGTTIMAALMTGLLSVLSPGFVGPSHKRRVARASAPLLLLLPVIGALASTVACGGGSVSRADARLRVDQVGYAADETKIAMLLAPRDATGASATVVDEHGTTAFTAQVGQSRG